MHASSPDASACASSAFQSGSPVGAPAARTGLLSGAFSTTPGSWARRLRSSANAAATSLTASSTVSRCAAAVVFASTPSCSTRERTYAFVSSEMFGLPANCRYSVDENFEANLPWSPLFLKNHCGDTTSIAFLFCTALPYAPAAMACHRL